MSKLKYLVIHTSDTPYDRQVTADDITLWHCGAKLQCNGMYKFLGSLYTLNQLKNLQLVLPSGKKIQASNTNGNGWSVSGYSDFIERSGKLINLNPYDFNDQIDAWEITNGVSGHNSESRSVCLAGGCSKDNKIKNGKNSDGSYMDISELYTKEQIDSLVNYVKMQLEMQPDLKVVGHNNLSTKTCPNFDVTKFMAKYVY